MASIIDTLVTEYRMKNQQYLQGAAQVTKATDKTAKSSNMTQKVISNMGGSLGKLGSVALSAAGAVAGLAVGVAVIGKSAFEQYAAFDSLVKALESVEGSADKARLAISDLKQIAKSPGIGFEEAVRGYTGLRNARVGGGLAQSLIAGVGNANARSGGGVEQFGRAMLALQQIAMKQFLQGEELLQLMEAGIPVQGLMRDRFGTADTEELKKRGITSAMVLVALNEELGKLPKAAGGAQNTLDNLSDSIKFAFINAGSGLASVQGPLDKFSESISSLTDANVWADAVTMFSSALGIIPDSSDAATEGLLRVAAGFVGFGTFLTKFIEGFKDFVASQLGPIGNFIKDQLGGDSNFGNFLKDAFGLTAAEQFYNDKKAEMDRLRTQKAVTDPSIKKDMTVGGQDPQIEVAKNTAKLVELQEKSIDFQTALIGGGQVGQQAFSGLQVANATGGGSATSRQLVKAIDDHIAQITGKRSVAVGRGYNYNR
jgi:tape measure domain-containing protein